MGIRQQKRPYAPHPEVHETDYGAKFVNAATETKEEPDVVTLDEQAKAGSEAVEATVEVKDDEKPAEKPKKKGGRPKKSK